MSTATFGGVSVVQNEIQAQSPEQQADLVVLIKDEAAAERYTRSDRALGRYPLRYYQTPDRLKEVVNRTLNPITPTELDRIVYEDGPRQTCAGCGEEFQPVSWWDITDPRLLELLEDGASLTDGLDELEDEILKFGAFYLHPDLANGYIEARPEMEYAAFCGAPYYFHPGKEMYFVRNSCLGDAKLKHPDKYWGTPYAVLQARLARVNADRKQLDEVRRQREAARSASKRKIAGFFGTSDDDDERDNQRRSGKKPGRGVVRS